jgi:H+/Cl- antiporter ClcA
LRSGSRPVPSPLTFTQLRLAGWPQLSRQITLVTGGAAGLAAAFSTPLGGIVFLAQELTQMHLARFRMTVCPASIIAGLTVHTYLGPFLYLSFPKIKLVNPPSLYKHLKAGFIREAIEQKRAATT